MNIINGLGITSSGIWEAAIRITPDELVPYDGWELIGARFYHWEPGTQSGDLKIYDQGTDTSPGNLITSEPYNVSGKGWRRINLTNPVPLNVTKDIWTSILMNQLVGDYPMGFDSGFVIFGKSDWAYIEGGGWHEIWQYGFYNNWGLEAIVEGEGKAELSIINVKGPIGVNTGVKNSGEKVVANLEYEMTVSGGILSGINRTVSGTKTELTVGETESIRTGLLFGFGPITINITADADNAFEVSTTKTGFILGPFVFGIK